MDDEKKYHLETLALHAGQQSRSGNTQQGGADLSDDQLCFQGH